MRGYEDGMAADVLEFHKKFRVPYFPDPGFPTEDVMQFRLNFLKEELKELEDAAAVHDMPGVADALVDLVYVAIGTALGLGIPFQAVWDEVHAANMRKVRSDGNGRHETDVVKPAGWVPPDVRKALACGS